MRRSVPFSLAGVVGMVVTSQEASTDDERKQKLILALSGGTLAGVLLSLVGSNVVGKPPSQIVDLYNLSIR